MLHITVPQESLTLSNDVDLSTAVRSVNGLHPLTVCLFVLQQLATTRHIAKQRVKLLFFFVVNSQTVHLPFDFSL